ncbi:MAG: ABC-type dipeptide/oligopeptide/nickel transport system, permease component [halophilic archaeon J07HB67]|jgi:ABC-type dipeptide/oligopeptide/nickel transport systems, permease components|nr:MAG: ABC-type dipeptide/oligopeptide/nickel transport system, permease component [halophilic archaeon J07HB67]
MATESLTTTEQTLERSDQTLRERVLATPRPALVWVTGLTLLVLPELGALFQVTAQAVAGVFGLLPGDPLVAAVNGLSAAADQIPTLLSRETIPNEGHRTAPGQWTGTFLGVEPMYAWSLRIGLIYLYTATLLWWLWRGYDTYREHYRVADWSPADDQIDRFARHDWGRFGLVVITIFVVMAVFAPAFGPTTIEQNNRQPYSYEIDYYDEGSQTVQTITVGVANVQSSSDGSNAVGPWSYDAYDRFHPAGTLKSGKDMMTFLAHGARVSLFIGGISIVLSGFIAVVLALVTAYYKGLADLLTVVTSDSIQVIPQLLLLIMAAAVFSNHWLSSVFDGGLLLILLFAFTNWTFIWRTIRGPALQVAEEEWIDAARSYGQLPRKTMNKHMLPYIVGYLLVYGSMRIGGIIVAIAGLSYLGLGITPPTPEWGRAIASGQNLVTTASWHIALIPGLMITLLVTGLNAFGDGIRDAIDPQSEGASSEEAEAAGGGA